MRKLSITVVILAFMACNNQPSQKATTNVQKSEYGYSNLKGKVESIETKTVNFDSTGKVKVDSTQSLDAYNKDGNLVKKTIKDNSGTTTIHENAYYAHGFMKEEKTTVNGTVQVRLTIDSFVNGQHVAAKIWDSTGKQIGYCDAINNEYGLLNRSKCFFMNGKLQFAWETKFDGPLIIGSSHTDSAGNVIRQSTIKRNDKGDEVEEHYSRFEKGDTTTNKLTHKYDSYDEKDNWTQQNTYKNGKLISVTKRAITYYKD
jgi:hypothetical protein